MFAASQLSFAYGNTPVLTDLTVTVPDGHRIALVGENGAGKSTLLALLAGTLTPDSGHVTRSTGPVGVLRQVPPWPAAVTVAEVVRGATAWADRLIAAVTSAGEQVARHPDDPAVAARLADALAATAAADAWTAADRAAALAGHLGVDTLPRDRRVGELSGGQRGRLQLLHLFAADPAGLLLDEPTNHLDDDALAWLTGCLVVFAGPVVMASHDRQLVEDVATGVLDLDPTRGPAVVVPGGWQAYRAHRTGALSRWHEDRAAHRAAEQRVRAGAREAARDRRTPRATDNDKFIPHAHAQQAQATRAARLRRARHDRAALDADRVTRPPEPLHLHADRLAAAGPTGVLLAATEVAVAGRLAPTRVDVPAGARILVTGPNGAGKSTLLAVLDGTIAPTSGTVRRQPGVRVARLAQDIDLDGGAGSQRSDLQRGTTSTPAEVYRSAAGPDAPELVSLGLIRPRDLTRPVAELSVGQRRRLALAVVIARAPHVLLLDEPTDHLSLTLVEELEEALGRSPGAVVVASHDRWLRRRWQGDELVLRPAP